MTTSKKKTKRGFILSQPLTLTAAEVVKAGRKAGIRFNAGYVYVTRFEAKNKGKLPPKQLSKKVAKRLEVLINKAIARAQKEVLAGLKRYLG